MTIARALQACPAFRRRKNRAGGPAAERAGPAAARTRPSFAHCASGAAAIEFAFVLPLFLALTFSGLEAGWYMTKSMLLDRALSRTVRLMRVGAANAPKTQAEMKKAICDEMTIVSNCVAATTVELTQVSKAADFPTSDTTCVDRGAAVQPTVAFTPGARSSIMYVRACIVSDPFTPGIGFALSLPKDSKGGYSLISLAAFMNEPG